METLINIWSQRKLSLKGKVTVLKSSIISQVSYLLSVLFVPDSVTLQKIDKLIFNFLWNGKTPKVRRATIIGNINEGGMKMPDIFSFHKTSKISGLEGCLLKVTVNKKC